jgi:hypothetical protein
MPESRFDHPAEERAGVGVRRGVGKGGRAGRGRQRDRSARGNASLAGTSRGRSKAEPEG